MTGTINATMKDSRSGRVTRQVLIAIVLAIASGFLVRSGMGLDDEAAARIVGYLHLPADVFLHLIKMIVAPLVFSTLVYGISHAGDSTGLGRIGLRAMAWFLTASLISLSIGMIIVNLFEPGAGLGLQVSGNASGIDPQALDLRSFVLHVFPISMTQAMAENEILQIVVFSLFIGFGLCAIGEKGKPIVIFTEAMVALMLKVTGYVMTLAPIAVYSALSSALIQHGPGILATFAQLLAEYYLALAILWVLILAAGFRFLGHSLTALVAAMREPLAIAFTTASSEAALPKLMERLESFGVPRRV